MIDIVTDLRLALGIFWATDLSDKKEPSVHVLVFV